MTLAEEKERDRLNALSYERMADDKFTIDLTPSWKTVTHVITMLIESHSKPSMFKQSDDGESPFQYISSEISRMSILLDTVSIEKENELRHELRNG